MLFPEISFGTSPDDSLNSSFDSDFYEDNGTEILNLLLANRSDLNAEVTELIAEQKLKEALKILPKIVELDRRLAGNPSNTTLLRYSDVYAGLGDFLKAKKFIVALRKTVSNQIMFLRQKETSAGLEDHEKLTLNSLEILLSRVLPKRFPMYADFGERASALKKLVKEKSQKNPSKNLEDTMAEFRYNLALWSFPEALRPILIKFIEKLARTNKKYPKNKKAYFEIADTVFAYVTEYFTEIDPENERFLVDICLKSDKEPEFNLSRATTTKNQIASEERIKNRVKRRLLRKSKFIAKNKILFEKLYQILAKLLNQSDEGFAELPDFLVQHLEAEDIDLA